MKKSFFQWTYNVNIYLLKYSIIYFVLSLVLYTLSHFFSTQIFSKESVKMINDILLKIRIVSTSLGFAHIFSFIVLICIEVSIRIVKDSINNYFKSIYQTVKLRHFLRQRNFAEQVQSSNTICNPTILTFNKSVSKCSVDIRKEHIVVFLKYPKTQQAQKLFKEMETHIKEEISSYNTNYYFSAPTRTGSHLWFTGTKR